MDGRLAIECNVAALKRILAALIAMAGQARNPHPVRNEPRRTLPRHLRNAVLRLLRPAESAARRLIIALARGVSVPPPHPRKPVVKPLRRRRHFMPIMPPEPRAPQPARPLALPLLDPLPRKARRRWVRQAGIPRIGFGDRHLTPIRLPPSPHDLLDATRLGLRLDALGRALDDMPRQVLRVARWQARQALARRRDAASARNKGRDAAGAQSKQCCGRIRRLSPLRMGRPPGARRKPEHEVFDVLDHAHRLAWWALEHPDTS